MVRTIKNYIIFYKQRGTSFCKEYLIYKLLIAIYSLFTYSLLATEVPKISGIELSGNSYFSDNRIFALLGKASNDGYDINSLDFFLKEVLDLYLSHSFLFVKVELVEIICLEDRFIAKINIDEGQIVKIENIILQGNKVTRENRLIRESKIQLAKPLTPDAIEEAEKRITNKRYILSANVIPVDQNTLLIDVKEGEMTFISAIFGYTTTKDKKNQFQGFMNAEFLNLMGTDRNFGLKWSSFDYKEVAQLQYHESGVVNVPISADLKINREQQDSTYVKTEIGTELFYDFQYQKIGLSLCNLDIYPGSREPKLLEKQTDSTIGFIWQGKYTDNNFNPTSGWNLSFANHNIFVKKGSESLYRYRVEAMIENYLTVTEHLSVANKAQIKHLQNKSLTMYDLIKTGGTFSIRGFHEDAYAGNSIFYTNSELRYALSRFSRFFIFADYGYVEDNRPDFKNRFYDLVGLGIGLRIQTRIGTVRMDYGISHADKKWMNPMDGIIHFGVEAAF